MSEADLNKAWAAAFELALGLGKRQHRQTMDDMGAELQLRGLEPPVHLVEKTMENISSESATCRPMRAMARDAIGDFIIKMDKPKHYGASLRGGFVTALAAPGPKIRPLAR